jgi:hypothetical protein
MECTIRKTLGVIEECPGALCPFWDEQTAACFFERRLGPYVHERNIAGWLSGLRRTLEEVRIRERRLQ